MRISMDTIRQQPKIMDDIIAALKQGKVIVYPTDTVYGLGCDAFNETAINKIRAMKQLDADKPMSIICSSVIDIHKYAILPGFGYTIVKEMLPGPYTFLLKIKNPKLRLLLPTQSKVGIRIPQHDIPLDIVQRMGRPLVSTSVNVTGQPVISFPIMIEKQFEE